MYENGLPSRAEGIFRKTVLFLSVCDHPQLAERTFTIHGHSSDMRKLEPNYSAFTLIRSLASISNLFHENLERRFNEQ
jgi:hypothetical protein